MSLNDLMEKPKKILIKDELDLIKYNAMTVFKIKPKYSVEMDIDRNMSNKHIGDFYGLLEELGRPVSLRYIELVLNGLYSSGEFNGEINSVRLLENNFATSLISNIASTSTIPKIKR